MVDRRATITLVRHADHGVHGRAIGHFDQPLSSAGELASLAFVREYAERPSVLVSSDLKRCLHTAKALAARFDVSLQIDPRWRELNFGRFENRNFDEIQASEAAAFAHWGQHWQRLGAPEGESFQSLVLRVREAFVVLPANALVITHAGAIRALWHERLGLSPEAVMAQPVPHLTPFLFEIDGARANSSV